MAGTCCLCSGHHPVSADSPDSHGSASLKNTPPPSQESCSGCSGIMKMELLRLRQLIQEPKEQVRRGGALRSASQRARGWSPSRSARMKGHKLALKDPLWAETEHRLLLAFSQLQGCRLWQSFKKATTQAKSRAVPRCL